MRQQVFQLAHLFDVLLHPACSISSGNLPFASSFRHPVDDGDLEFQPPTERFDDSEACAFGGATARGRENLTATTVCSCGPLRSRPCPSDDSSCDSSTCCPCRGCVLSASSRSWSS